jgi:hypothetical protein
MLSTSIDFTSNSRHPFHKALGGFARTITQRREIADRIVVRGTLFFHAFNLRAQCPDEQAMHESALAR